MAMNTTYAYACIAADTSALGPAFLVAAITSLLVNVVTRPIEGLSPKYISEGKL